MAHSARGQHHTQNTKNDDDTTDMTPALRFPPNAMILTLARLYDTCMLMDAVLVEKQANIHTH